MNKINLSFSAIFILIASYIAADLFWLVVKPEVVQSAPHSGGKQYTDNLGLANNIFDNKKIVEVVEPEPEIIYTKLNLDLIGVLFREQKSFAIIAPTKNHRLAANYKVGDSVKPGAIVKEIGTDFVILKRGDKLEKLIYKFNDKKSISVKNTSNTQKSKLSTIQRQKLDDYRLEILSNPKKLLSIVSVIPAFKNGKMIGVKVKPNKDKKIFKDLGFKTNDIITKINRIYINNFSNFAKIRKFIYNNSSFDLQIKRNNKTVHLSIQL